MFSRPNTRGVHSPASGAAAKLLNFKIICPDGQAGSRPVGIPFSILATIYKLQGSFGQRGEGKRARNTLMKRLFAVLCAMAYFVGTTPVDAQSGSAPRGARGSRPIIVDGPPAPRIRTDHSNRIPAPLPPPPQAPAIHGPLNPTGLPPMGGARFP